ncbi:unnamed protein product [Closterium sp. NIES-64]|nr:unnamed protein product [Closterium sp. NIES-64]
MQTRQRSIRVREEAGGEAAVGGGTAEEGRSREESLGNTEQGSRTNEAVITAEGVSNAEANNEDDGDDMSGYGVASEEDLRNAKQIADAILSGRFFAGMSRGKQHWAGDDVGRAGTLEERMGEGLGDWLGEAGGGQAEAEGQVAVEKQRFARVALVGAPNAGKSALMNRLVGVKVSAVSRKTNTTQREVVGIRTIGPTQLVSFEFSHALTLLVSRAHAPHSWADSGATIAATVSVAAPGSSLLASSAALHCHVVALVIDADRQIRRYEGACGGRVW